MIIHARAPVRIDFAGGWSDVPHFAEAEGGVVANAALSLHVHVECRLVGQKIRLHAEDLGVRYVAAGPSELRYDGTLDLHKAALNMLPVTGGLELLTRSEVPHGSGLGASGALDVALVAALARARREHYDATELAELGFALESTELKLMGGRQDQYAAALGGWHELIFGGAHAVEVRAIGAPLERRRELERHMIVAFTGESHFSAQTHNRVWQGYAEAKPGVVSALRTIRDLGRAAAEALRSCDWRTLAQVVEENWQAQKRLDPTISTAAVERVELAARAAGAWGLKAAGAGAGGCLLILASPEAIPAVQRAVRDAGATVLNTGFAAEGARVWEEDPPDA
jgi:D-glycero-alpha-D-manno-heptose-7-phosphate kinase